MPMNNSRFKFLRRNAVSSLTLATTLALTGIAPSAFGAPPPNDDRANATVLAGSSGRLEVSNVDATKEPGEANHAGNVGGKSVWFSFTAPVGISTRIDTVGTGFDTLMSIYVDTSTVVGLSNDQLQNGIIYGAGAGGYTQSRIAFNAVANTKYLIAIDGYNPGTGAYSGPLVINWNQTAGVPSNDAFATPIELTGRIGAYSGRNQNATKEAGEPNHAGNAGGRSVWYRWTPDVDGPAVIDTLGSSFDTLLAVYTGTSVGALTPVGGMDNYFGTLNVHGRVAFNAVAGTTYYVAVDGKTAGTGSIALHYYLSADAPANDNFASAVALPGTQGSIPGSNFNGSKEAGEPAHAGDIGGSSVWYSWTPAASGPATFSTFGVLFDSTLGVYTGTDVATLTPVPGASNDDAFGPGGFTLSRVNFPAVAGTTYWIAVDGFAGEEASFSLNWDQAVNAPTNDLFASAMELPGRSGSITTSNSTAVYEVGEPITGAIGTTIFMFSFGGKSLWFKWTAPSSRPVFFDTFGSSFDTTLALMTGTELTALTVLTNSDNGLSNAVTVAQSRFAWSNVVAGTTYYLQLDGANYGNDRLTPNGTVVLNYSQPGGTPTNDLFLNGITLAGEAGQTNGTTIEATVEVNEPEHAAISPNASVWYRWTAPSTGWFTFDTLQNPTLDTVLAVYTGNTIDSVAEVMSNDDATPGSVVQSRCTFLATAGTEYRVAVDTKAPTQGDFILRWRPTLRLAASRQPGNLLRLVITAAAPGFYQLQESTAVPTAWSTFDSVSFTDAAGGTVNYDAGSLATPARRIFRVIE